VAVPLAGRTLPGTAPGFPVATQHPGQETRRPLRYLPGWAARTQRSWPLLAVLAAQAALSLRLVWANTAFQDEALYLRAGHLEWAHWLHGSPIPDFPAYFSGAPVIYPPVGALVDSIGGLTAARALSLGLMLGVTSLLWATTARLYGRRAALLASGLFATLAGTQFLGAVATYDALALLMVALAVWLGVRSSDLGPCPRALLLVLCSCTLAAADAVKYAAALFTPTVLAVVIFATWRRRRGTVAVAAGLTVLGAWLALILVAIAIGGHGYWLGIRVSTLSRSPATTPVAEVLQRAYVWTSLIMVLAVLGAMLASRRETSSKFLPAVLAATGLLVPATQARLHTMVSLQKHVVFGAWFAAIAAGYALARLSRVDPGRGWAAVMALPIAASTLFGSMGQAAALYATWPNSANVIRVLRSATHAHPGQYLAEDYDVEAYYLRSAVPWPRWSSTYYFHYQGVQPGPDSYRAAIARHYFSLVILTYGDTATTDRAITEDIRHAGGYYVLTHAGHFTIWAAQPAAASGPPGKSHGSH
jgi:hypothetical protein